MTIVFVASNKTAGGPGGGSFTFDNTGSNFLVAATAMDQASHSAGPTWNGTSLSALTEKQSGGTGNVFNRLFYLENPAVGSFTAALSGTAIFSGFNLAAFSGVRLTSSFDNENSGNSATSTVQPGSLTPNQANSLVVSACGHNSGSASTVDSPFTIATNNSYAFGAGNNYGCGMAYEIQTTATARNPTFTATSALNMASVIAAFKAAAAASTDTRLLMGV